MLRYILLAIGAVFVLGGVTILFVWFGQVRKAPEVVGAPTEIRTSIITVAHAIPKGTLLRQDDLKSKVLGPEEHLQPGSVVSGQEKDLLGALSRRDFAEGEPLIASDFIKPSDRNFLAAVLKPGSRAISIFVDAAQSVAGLALQGDYVDVILIQSFDDKITVDPGRKTVGETVLHGVRVIAIDQALALPQAGLVSAVLANAEGRVPKTVTLEVTERQAEKLLVASETWRFSAYASASHCGDPEPDSGRTQRQAGLGVGCLARSRRPRAAPAGKDRRAASKSRSAATAASRPMSALNRQHTRSIGSVRPLDLYLLPRAYAL